ncbi:MAG: Permease of the drug/metabolite transporter (DMT) superfamily [Pelagibacterales bacterium]|nr:Permease of the drug/metabolite transporter (DMT) superfamily [Pelagibacterales bacterium]
MKAIIYNLLAWAILPFMDVIAKYLSSEMSFLQITWARYFFTVFFSLPFMFFFFRKNLTWTTQPKLQTIRGLLLFCANILFFYSISIISMAKALTLAFVAPLITTALSPFMLNEKVGFRRWSAVIVGFVGSLIVIRPGFLDFNLATIAGLGTGFFYGLYLIVTRKLHTSDNPLLTLLLTGVVGLILGSFIVPFVWIDLTFNQWSLLALMGIFACIGHFFLILSLKYADASKLAPLGYFEIVTNVMLGYYFFSDFPDYYSWIGLLIITSSGIYISFREKINR